MRQIPRYLLIGSGRLGKHLAHYFSLLNIPFNTWQRPSNNLNELVNISDVIILAISDDSIEDFITQNSFKDKILVHCSGSLYLDNVIGIHPLMTFGSKLYDLETYQKISFVIDSFVEEFKKIFPKLNNKVYSIPENKKPYYHALCVMSGNFTSLLWAKLFKELEHRFALPKEAAYPYLKAITNNILNDYTKALTGPLIRNDIKTINNNLEALIGDNFLPIYQAFLTSWRKENGY